MRSNSSSVTLPTTKSMPAELQDNLSNPAIPQHNQKYPLLVPSYCHFSDVASNPYLIHLYSVFLSPTHSLDCLEGQLFFSFIQIETYTSALFDMWPQLFRGVQAKCSVSYRRKSKRKKKVVRNHQFLHISLRCGHKSYCKNSCSYNMKK